MYFFRLKNAKQLIISLFAAFFSSLPLYAQIDNTFWFAAPEISPNHAHNPITFCFTSFSSPATVTISQPANPSYTPVTINLNPYSYYALDVTSMESTVSTAFLQSGNSDASPLFPLLFCYDETGSAAGLMAGGTRAATLFRRPGD